MEITMAGTCMKPSGKKVYFRGIVKVKGKKVAMYSTMKRGYTAMNYGKFVYGAKKPKRVATLVGQKVM